MTATATAPTLSHIQTIQMMQAVDHQLQRLIGDCLPDSPTLSPIRCKAELERRQRCLEWARELVEAAAHLGLTNTICGLDYVVALELAERFIQGAWHLDVRGCLPIDEPVCP